jgi:hypothetical protein
LAKQSFFLYKDLDLLPTTTLSICEYIVRLSSRSIDNAIVNQSGRGRHDCLVCIAEPWQT